MEISVNYGAGERFVLTDNFYRECMGRPLVTEKREIYSLPIGDCELVRLVFDGIYIVYGDMQLYNTRTLNFELLDHENLVEMHFTLSGSGTMMDNQHGQQYQFRENEHNMHYLPSFAGYGTYESSKRYKFFEIHFPLAYFLQLAQSGSPGLQRFAEIIAGGNITRLSRESLPISFAMHQCIQGIMKCRLEGGLKLLFLQSKCIELLALQAQMYEEMEAGPSGNIHCLIDKERILYARQYLVQHALQPPSLAELAKVAGINEFKLKQGFKQVFNTTVFGYLSDYKLHQAKELLLQGHTAIKEVADNLGYSSVQHFSHAFRKKFGVTPGNVKK